MYGRFAPSTIDATIRYAKRITIDLDKIKNHYKISEWVFKLDVSEDSRNNFIKVINRYLDFINVDYRVKKRPKRGLPDVWRPSDAEVRKLLSHFGPWPYGERNYLLVKILAIGGLRSDEVRNLGKKDFKYKDRRSKKTLKSFLISSLVTELKKEENDEQNDFISTLQRHYQKAVESISEKNYTRHYYVHVIGKFNKERNVPIPKDLYLEVMRYFSRHHGLEYLFDNGQGQPIKNKRVRVICKEVGKGCGIPKLHPHALRHWRTTDLWKKGVDVLSISKFLGHSDISTTMLYLRTLEEEDVQREIILKDPLFGQEDIIIKDSIFGVSPESLEGISGFEEM